MTDHKKRTIFNPVTGSEYEVREKSTKYKSKGKITGIWRRKIR